MVRLDRNTLGALTMLIIVVSTSCAPPDQDDSALVRVDGTSIATTASPTTPPRGVVAAPSPGPATAIAAGPATPPAAPPPPAQQSGPLSVDFDTQASADACFAGLMEECDRLFRTSEPGSTLERFAATCGDRDVDPGRPCAQLFSSSQTVLGTLLAEGINVREANSVESAVTASLRESTGARIPITGVPIDGWYPIIHQFEQGWIFGAFLFPIVDGDVVVRTSDREAIAVLDENGEETSAGTGSFGLVVDSSSAEWVVLLPDGRLGRLDPTYVDVVATG